jgi:hypothetical protein
MWKWYEALTGNRARLGADVDRYSFIARDLHSLLLAGLPALRICFPECPPITAGSQPCRHLPLFKIDARDMQGQLLVEVAKVKEAEANLAKTKNLLKRSPRA